MSDVKLTHLQRRRLIELDLISRSVFRHATKWITSHWSASRAANQTLCDLGFAERYGREIWSDTGKDRYVGEARITPAGVAWLETNGERA